MLRLVATACWILLCWELLVCRECCRLSLTSIDTSLHAASGSHTDDISGKTSWCRLPFAMVTQRTFVPGQTQLATASGMGGLIYLVIEFVSCKCRHSQGCRRFFLASVTTLPLLSHIAPWRLRPADNMSAGVCLCRMSQGTSLGFE